MSEEQTLRERLSGPAEEQQPVARLKRMITVRMSEETFQRIEKARWGLRTSQNRFCVAALEAVLEELEQDGAAAGSDQPEQSARDVHQSPRTGA